jgi:predicted O-methyltransferase YrrM
MLIEHIRGFCNFDGLYEHYVNAAEGGETFVELGSLWGRSAIKMGQLIRDSGKDIKFFCVDFWDLRGITDKVWSAEDLQWVKYMGLSPDQTNVDLCYETFLTTLFKFELQNHVFPIKLSTRSAYKLFKNNSIDFLFIDADHSYEGVKLDISLWEPKVVEGGVISGHDYDWEGVARAVNEMFADRQIVTFNTSWVVQK